MITRPISRSTAGRLSGLPTVALPNRPVPFQKTIQTPPAAFQPVAKVRLRRLRSSAGRQPLSRDVPDHRRGRYPCKMISSE
jgi:hypothetical protein